MQIILSTDKVKQESYICNLNQGIKKCIFTLLERLSEVNRRQVYVLLNRDFMVCFLKVCYEVIGFKTGSPDSRCWRWWRWRWRVECSSKSVGWSLFHEWQKHTEISLREISSILEAAVDVIWCYINKNLKQAK